VDHKDWFMLMMSILGIIAALCIWMTFDDLFLIILAVIVFLSSYMVIFYILR
jgi:hypothetical protein